MTNVDTKLANYKARLLRLENEKREAAEAIREVGIEMKSAGLSKDEIAGVKLAVRREFETAEKKAARISREEIADMLGDFAHSPLGMAAISAHPEN